MCRVKLALVVNPKSGAGRGADELAERLAAPGHEVSTFTLDDVDDAATSGADRVVVAGGDGSIGPVFAGCAEHGASLAILPAGTANDFARAIGVPADFDAAVDVATDAGARHTTVWGATLDGHPFVNVASIGLAVNAAREAAPFKSKLGPVAYAIGAVIAGAKGKEVHCRVSVDGEQVYEGDVWQALVAASGSFGGIVQLPDSDPGTKEMELFVVESRSKLTVIRRVWGMRRGGNRGGTRFFQGHRIRIDVEPDLLWNVDGEILDLGDVTAEPLGPVEIYLPPATPERPRWRRR
jgi:diacylglycerol kinase family enzyme